jgi:hypothetical protein
VTGTRAHQALVPGGIRLDGERPHDGPPVGVVAVLDADCDGGAERAATADAPLEERLVLLDLHPAAASVAVLAARQFAVDEDRIDFEPRGNPLEDRGQAGPV